MVLVVLMARALVLGMLISVGSLPGRTTPVRVRARVRVMVSVRVTVMVRVTVLVTVTVRVRVRVTVTVTVRARPWRTTSVTEPSRRVTKPHAGTAHT